MNSWFGGEEEAPPVVREIGRSTPRIRPELRFVAQRFGDEDFVVVSDPLSDMHYRLGRREYSLLALLDGKTTVAEAMGILASQRPHDALAEQEAQQLVSFALDTQLIVTDAAMSIEQLERSARNKADATIEAQSANPMSNIFFIQIPVINPDKILDGIFKPLNFFLGWPLFLAWLALGSVAAFLIFERWPAFTASADNLLQLGNLAAIGVIFGVLKVIHEFGHGAMCKRYGGRVPEMGVMLIFLMMPMAYCDVSSSWTFTSRWRRMHVACGGILFESFVAAIFAIIWANSPPGALRTMAYNVVITAGVSTLMFNLNPLMRFDGYYVLVDLFDVPNLHTQADKLAQHLAKRILCGVDSTYPVSSLTRAAFLLLYSVSAAFYKLFLYLVLGLAAMGSAEGIRGFFIVLLPLALFGMFGMPFYKMIKFALFGEGMEQPNHARVALSACVIGSLIYLGATYGYEKKIVVPAVVVHTERAIVRAYAPGFIEQILVDSGERVEAGQPVARLRNRGLEAGLIRLRCDIDSSRVRLRQLESLSDDGRGQAAAVQAEREVLVTLRNQLSEQLTQAAALTLRAEVAGVVVTPRLHERVGSFLTVGEELCTIADPGSRTLMISIGQDQVGRIRARIGDQTEVWLLGRRRFLATLTEVSPRATRDLPDLALATTNGGSLDVVERQSEAEKKRQAVGGADAPGMGGELELVDARFKGRVALVGDAQAGEVGWVRLVDDSLPIWLHAWRGLEDWTTKKINAIISGRKPGQ